MSPGAGVVVCHHQSLVAELLGARLVRDPGLELLRTVQSPAGVPWDLVHPQLLVLEQRFLHAVAELVPSDPGPALIVLADTDSPPSTHDAVQAVRAGARAWLHADSPPEDLSEAARTVLAGRRWLPEDTWTPLVDALLDPDEALPEAQTLTPRELEVLAHLSAGHSTQATAEAMYVSRNTVRSHRNRLLGKLGVHSALEAVALDRRLGISTSRDRQR